MDWWRDLFFPPKCPSCGILLRWRAPWERRESALCKGCRLKWEDEKLETCGVCAERISKCRCMTPFMEDAKCKGLCKLTYYSLGKDKPVQNRVIYHLKRSPDRRCAAWLAEELRPVLLEMLEADGISTEEVILTHIPRSRRARLYHGTDQAQALCASLGRVCRLPAASLLRRRKGAEREQKRLSAQKRLQNAMEAFEASRGSNLRGRTVVLLDDVVTTGAGMAAGARLLRKMGAKRVYCAVIATDECNRDGV